MYLIVIAWIYVVLMMSVAEATNSTGTVLGGVMTFFLYGVGPIALVVYLLGTPGRRKAIRQREALAVQQALEARKAAQPPQAKDAGPELQQTAAADSLQPDARSHAAGGVETVTQGTGVPPVRKEP